MTRPALRAAGALLLLSTMPALAAAQPPAPGPGAVVVRPTLAAPAPPVKPAPPSPTAVAFNEAVKEVMAGRATGSYAQWLDTLPGFRFSPATSTLLTRQFGTARLFTVKRQPLAGGARDYLLTMPALRHAGPDGSRMSWDAVAGHSRIESDGITIVSQVSAPRFTVEDKTMRLELRGMTASGTTQDQALAYGSGAGELASLQMTTKADGTTIAMHGLFAKYALTDQGAAVGMTYDVGMRTLAVKGERIDDINVSVKLNGLDKTALETLGKLGKELNARQAQTPAAGPDPSLAAPLLRQLGLAVIAKGAAIVLDDISFSYRGSKARMQGELHVDNGTAADLDQPMALIKKVTGHAEVELPLAMLRGFADNIARTQLAKQQPGADAATLAKFSQTVYDGLVRSAVSSGYLRVDGDLLKTTIDIRDGAILLNGKPLQLPKPTPPVAAVESSTGSLRARRVAEKCTLPDYPADVVAQDRALSLAMQVTIAEDGTIGKLDLARSSGIPAYDAAVLTAAKRCTYIPALHNGKPVAVSEVWEIVRAPGTARP